VRETGLDAYQSSWNQRCPSPFAVPTTASMERELAVDMTNRTPTLATVLEAESSLYLCRIPCTSKGTMIMAKGSLMPKRVV
jgi:hypothetical protein